MKGYGQFCPIAMACETFAERWTPLILRELLAGSRRLNEIRQGLPLISRAAAARAGGGGARPESAARPRPGTGVPADARGRGIPRSPGAPRGVGAAVGHRPVRSRQSRPDAAHVERAPANRLRPASRPTHRRALRLPRVPVTLPVLPDVLADPRA